MASDRIKRNPAARAKPPTDKRARKPVSERATWTREETEAFLTFVATDRLRALHTLVLTTGLRRSEALGLPWHQVDLEEGKLAVVQALVEVDHRPQLKPIPKNDHSRRRLALDGGMVRILRGYRRAQVEECLLQGNAYEDSGLIFIRDNGTPLRPAWVSKRSTRLAAAAGLPDLSPRPFHGLRHTYATLALEAGVPRSPSPPTSTNTSAPESTATPLRLWPGSSSGPRCPDLTSPRRKVAAWIELR